MPDRPVSPPEERETERTAEDFLRAIAKIEASRATHLAWIQYIEAHPDYPTNDVGAIAHHQRVIADYDDVIGLLRCAAAMQAAGVEPPSELQAALAVSPLPARVAALEEENAELHAELSDTKQALLKARSLEEENERLRDALAKISDKELWMWWADAASLRNFAREALGLLASGDAEKT